MRYSDGLAQFIETGLAEIIAEADFTGQGREGIDEDFVARVETFEEAMVLTHDKGLVVRLADRSEIRLTIQALAANPERWEDDDEEAAHDEAAWEDRTHRLNI